MIDKSSRHRKIVGNFGEYLVCNWLSRSGFEVCVVDHTGMDLIAYNRQTKERLGITVKSRSRVPRTETGSVYIFRESKDDRQKLLDACQAFGCEPWVGVYVECEDVADLFLTSLANYERKYALGEKREVHGWGMTEKKVREYIADVEVKHIGMKFTAHNWWKNIPFPSEAVTL